MYKELMIICVGNMRFRYSFEDMEHWEYDAEGNIFVKLKNGTNMKFFSRNTLAVQIIKYDETNTVDKENNSD